jgi:hypothetical protein
LKRLLTLGVLTGILAATMVVVGVAGVSAQAPANSIDSVGIAVASCGQYDGRFSVEVTLDGTTAYLGVVDQGQSLNVGGTLGAGTHTVDVIQYVNPVSTPPNTILTYTVRLGPTSGSVDYGTATVSFNCTTGEIVSEPRVNSFDSVAFCTDGSTLFFDLTYSARTDWFFFGFESDGPLFTTTPSSHVGFQWNGYTNTYPYPTRSRAIGAGTQRWAIQNPLQDFTFGPTAVDGQYRFNGSVPHGTSPLAVGDTTYVAMRTWLEDSSHDGDLHTTSALVDCAPEPTTTTEATTTTPAPTVAPTSIVSTTLPATTTIPEVETDIANSDGTTRAVPVLIAVGFLTLVAAALRARRIER